MAHTPGPWFTERDDSLKPSEDVFRVVSEVTWKRWRTYNTTARVPYLATVYNVADTALIAAAPDLLKACKGLARALTDGHDRDEAYNEAVAAIVRAETPAPSNPVKASELPIIEGRAEYWKADGTPAFPCEECGAASPPTFLTHTLCEKCGPSEDEVRDVAPGDYGVHVVSLNVPCGLCGHTSLGDHGEIFRTEGGLRCEWCLRREAATDALSKREGAERNRDVSVPEYDGPMTSEGVPVFRCKDGWAAAEAELREQTSGQTPPDYWAQRYRHWAPGDLKAESAKLREEWGGARARLRTVEDSITAVNALLEKM